MFKPEDIDIPAKDFISTYASYMEDVGIVGKGPDGYALYPSRTAPVKEEHVEFFEEWVRNIHKKYCTYPLRTGKNK